METCMRGFSYMPPMKIEQADLQLVPEEDLDKTWRASRRQRVKEQEQKIWEEFVQEKDVVKNVLDENPYQFLTDLPETCLKELLTMELEKLRQDRDEEIEMIEQQQQQEQQQDLEEEVEEENFEKDFETIQDDSPCICLSEPTIATVEEIHEEEPFFRIYHDDNDGPEAPDEPPFSQDKMVQHQDVQESAHEESPPCTVREVLPKTPTKSFEKICAKSSENISSILESSIYCARIKDLRIKICDEMTAVCTTLECLNISMLDHEEIIKYKKRSYEYATRFNRIHLYQVQRLIHDIKRHNSNALPFAKYTHFQSQVIRISSLHQSMLQTLTVFHKSIEQTLCLPPAGDILKSVLITFKVANEVCQSVPVPSKCDADQTLFNDTLIESCNILAAAADHYTSSVTSYMNNTNTHSRKATRKSRKKASKPNFTVAKPSHKSGKGTIMVSI